MPKPMLIGLLSVFSAALAAPEDRSPSARADRIAAIEQYVESYVSLAAFDGVVLIAEGEQVVYQQAFGHADYRTRRPMPLDARFRIASLSKQVTLAAIGKLADEGKLSLSAPLSRYLPDYPRAADISLKQLTDHTAGVAHSNRMDWMDMSRALTLDEIVEGLAGEALLFEPGSDRAYSNGGYALLARVIEKVTGQSFAGFIETRIAERGYRSIGHEHPREVVPDMAYRYAPGPVLGQRVEAAEYLTSNRIGGGSLYAAAGDLWRLFRDSYRGNLVSEAMTAALFAAPEDGDLTITGRSPGTLAQIYLDLDDDLTVLTLSSSSAWPGSFNKHVVALYRGQPAVLNQINLGETSAEDAKRRPGRYVADRFGWTVEIRRGTRGLVYVQDSQASAFPVTSRGEHFLPLYDWLCQFEPDASVFECRQRDPSAQIRFVFRRQSAG